MIRSISTRFWFWVFLLIAFPVGYAAAGQCVVTMVSPVEGSAVPPELTIMARITDGGYPFTEAGEKRWVEATLRDRTGQTLAQLPLRDNGQGADRRRGDGEWSAPAVLHLSEGYHRLIITVQRGSERQFHVVQFTVSSGTDQGEVSKHTVNEASPERQSGSIDALTKSMRRIEENAAGVSGFAGLYIICAAILGLCGIQAFLFLRQFQAQRSINTRAEQSAGEQQQGSPPSSPGGEKWRPLFGGVETIQNAVTGISRDLSATFRANQQLKDQAMHIAEELISLYRSVDALNSPATQALKMHLGRVLNKAGVEIWAPLVGEPAPEGCEQRPDLESSAQGGTVTAILQPGFRMRQDKESVVLVKPVVSVAGPRHGGSN